jgi:hypothetical protein
MLYKAQYSLLCMRVRVHGVEKSTLFLSPPSNKSLSTLLQCITLSHAFSTERNSKRSKYY